MSIKELFVNRVPLFERDNVVHHHVGLELSKIMQWWILVNFIGIVVRLRN